MKKHTKIVLASVLVIGVTATAVSYAKGKYCRLGSGITEHISESLELNEQQEEKLDVVALKMRKMRREGRDQHHQGRQEMAALLNDATLDQAKALELIREKHRNMEEKAAGMIAIIADFTNTLSDSQKDELKDLMEKGRPFGGSHFMHGGEKHRQGWQQGSYDSTDQEARG